MERKDQIDKFGASALVIFAIVLACNQVVIKLTNGGFSPVFAAGARSLIGIFAVGLWIALRRKSFGLTRRNLPSCLLAGFLFAIEFICLYIALDVTTVSRASIIFYSMPVWLALIAHFLLPGERLSPRRMTGLALAMAGVSWALLDRQTGEASLLGDLAAFGAAIAWAGIALLLRLTPMSEMKSDTQLFWQLFISAPLLLGASLFFGPVLRDPEMLHVVGLLFQAVGVVAVGYMVWFWLMSIYPASDVASFSFLSPVFSVLLGWLVLGEEVGLSIWGGLVLVAIGLILINKRRRVTTA
jgi:drug/metabolite transporter (DMT)-like permease